MAKKHDDEEEEFEAPDDDRPWGEEKWEAFMRESDLRSARFGEIFETVMDDPNRDRIIAKEMGWDWLSEALDERDEARARGELDEDDEFADLEKAEADAGGDDAGLAQATDAGDDEAPDQDEPETDEFDDDDEDGKASIPSYRLAFDVGMKIHHALRPYMQGTVTETDHDETLGKAYIGCQIAAAKISGGHAMGYDDDVLCGNIANCKRGLAGAEEAEAALLELKEAGKLPAELVDQLLPDVRAVIAAVKERIEELRKRVWW